MEKEAANELAAVVEQLKITNQYLSSIQYLLLYGDKINKTEHYDKIIGRIKNITADSDHKFHQ